MNTTWSIDVFELAARRWITCWGACLAAVALVLGGALPASAVPSRVALVVVRADLTSRSPLDQVNISITGSDERALLSTIAADLGQRLGAAPRDLTFTSGDPDFVAPGTIGLDLRLPVVPRVRKTVPGDSNLPIDSFVDALAAHVSRVRMVFVIRGEFDYEGPPQYTSPQAAITVEPPALHLTGRVPEAFYAVNALMKNPDGTYGDPEAKPGITPSTRRNRILILLSLAAVVGLAAGLFLVALFARWKKEDAVTHEKMNVGGSHD